MEKGPAVKQPNILRLSLLSILIFSIFASVILIFFFASLSRSQNISRARFDADVKASEQFLDNYISNYINSVYSILTLFAANNDVTKDDWDQYISRYRVVNSESDNSIRFFIKESNTNIKPENDKTVDLVNITDQLNTKQKSNAIDVTTTESTTKSYVISYVENPTKNKGYIGSDLASNAKLNQAIERSIDSGLPIATDVIEINSTNHKKAIFMFLPVYNKTPSNDLNINRGRNTIRGVIGSILFIDDLKVALHPDSDIEFQIHSVSKDNQTKDLIFTNNPEKFTQILIDPKHLYKDVTVLFADKVWGIHYAARTDYKATLFDKWFPWALLIVSIIIDIILSSIIFNLMLKRSSCKI